MKGAGLRAEGEEPKSLQVRLRGAAGGKVPELFGTRP